MSPNCMPRSSCWLHFSPAPANLWSPMVTHGHSVPCTRWVGGIGTWNLPSPSFMLTVIGVCTGLFELTPVLSSNSHLEKASEGHYNVHFTDEENGASYPEYHNQ